MYNILQSITRKYTWFVNICLSRFNHHVFFYRRLKHSIYSKYLHSRSEKLQKFNLHFNFIAWTMPAGFLRTNWQSLNGKFIDREIPISCHCYKSASEWFAKHSTSHINEKPQQITPPLARLAAHGIILCWSFKSMFSPCSRCTKWRQGWWELEYQLHHIVSCSLFGRQLDSIECSQNKLTLCLSKLKWPGFCGDKISIHPFVRLSLQLFVATNRLESLSDWSELFHTCMCYLSANHKQV